MDQSFSFHQLFLKPLQNAIKTFTILTLIFISLLPIIEAKAQINQEEQTILVVGDSISAEYGLERGMGWVALLQEQLQKNGFEQTRVINASISGDTTAGGRARLPSALKKNYPTLVIIELGANDALRGLPLTQSHDNLKAMVEMSQAAGADVLLLGMQVPPNYGASYTKQFAQIYESIAAESDIALVPLFLAGIADIADANLYFQHDRIHPNEKAQPIMLQNVWPQIKTHINPKP